MDFKKIQKLATIIFVIIILASLAYFFFVGESIKEDHVYRFERDPQPGLNDLSATITVALLINYLEENPGKSTPQVCLEDELKCVDTLSPNEEIKQKCKEAVNAIKNFTQKIKNENSIIFGFNTTLFKLQASSCPQLEYAVTSGGFIPIMPQGECSVNYSNLYGADIVSQKLDACLKLLFPESKRNQNLPN